MASYPGNYAVPGLIWPGFMLPGEPVLSGTVPAPVILPPPPPGALSVVSYLVGPGSAVAVGFVPAGAAYAAVASTLPGAFIGPGTAVSLGNGLFIPGAKAPVPFPGVQGASAQQLYAVTAGGTVTVTFLACIAP